jgi:hypothetical protein
MGVKANCVGPDPLKVVKGLEVRPAALLAGMFWRVGLPLR